MDRKGDLQVSNAPVTVEEFLAIRERVAEVLKESSQTQKPTRIRQAEDLMRNGLIDIDVAREQLGLADVTVYAEIEP